MSNGIRRPSVYALVLNYNGAQFLGECLASLVVNDYPNLHVRVVDNASTDKSVELVRTQFPGVDVILMEQNLGFSVAYNRAVSSIQGDYYFFLNNDVVLEPNVVRELVTASESFDDIAAVTPKMRFSESRGTLNGCGGMLDRFGFGLNVGIGEVDEGQYDQPMEVFYAVGAAMLVKAEVWRQVGGFDERFFAYFEDSDWCWRARLLGYRVMYAPAVVYHKWRGTWTDIKERMYLQERNRLAMLLKNYSMATLLRTLPLYFGLAALRIAWVSSHWGPQIGLYMIASYLWNLLHLGSTLIARQQTQRTRILSDLQILRALVPSSLELAHRRNQFLSQRR